MLSRASIRPAVRASQLVFQRTALRTASRALGSNSKSISEDDGYNILVAQRRNRPLSPDLTIYQPQLTWYMSGAHRITGIALGGAFYLYTIGYAVLPALGVTALAPASVAAAFGALPLAVKLATKFIAALPFTFHSLNGIRHLMWDTAKGLTIPKVYQSGYLVMGLSLVTALGLAVI